MRRGRRHPPQHGSGRISREAAAGDQMAELAAIRVDRIRDALPSSDLTVRIDAWRPGITIAACRDGVASLMIRPPFDARWV
jgi:hypothetical protein